jgi:hypothetical protein
MSFLAGRYKVRVVSVDSPDIQTPWQDIIVGKVISSLRYKLVSLSVASYHILRVFFSFSRMSKTRCCQSFKII